MNTNKIIEKRIYSYPEIICIELDNEISLVLESTPPDGPGEVSHSTLFNKDNPFKECVV